MTDISADEWRGFFPSRYPFLLPEFFKGLEASGSTNGKTGWQACHLQLKDEDAPLAFAPAFLKNHSYGEYVFDWAWADAWHRSGIDYYPKLVTAIPFTPATGPRLWLNPNRPDSLPALIAAVTQWCTESSISSWHILFPDQSLSDQLVDHGLVQRMTTQFHWFNRGYSDFDDFLATFNSRKRKALRKERNAIAAQNLSITTKVGAEITPEDWQFFHYCYQTTYLKRSGHEGYLTDLFFTDICPTLNDSTVMVIGHEGDMPVAAALYFVDDDTLYGRYWGCIKEFDFLHFEACYYQGIEYCIKAGLSKFDPGAQGEHKIQRGFEPTLTYSNHWIAEPRLKAAVEDFCRRDCDHVKQYREQAATLLPFKAE